MEPHTNFSVDLHVVDILRSRTGELQRAGVSKGEVFCVAFLFGVNGHTHAAVRLCDRVSDGDDGVWIGGHRHPSAAWIKTWCIVSTVSREVTFYTFYLFLFMLATDQCVKTVLQLFVYLGDIVIIFSSIALHYITSVKQTNMLKEVSLLICYL